MTAPVEAPSAAAALFDELRAVFPDRVGRAGWSVDHGNHRLSVVDMGSVFRWDLSHVRGDGSSRFVIGGSACDLVDGWLWACACYLSEIEEAAS